jgi:hypothetical protein
MVHFLWPPVKLWTNRSVLLGQPQLLIVTADEELTDKKLLVAPRRFIDVTGVRGNCFSASLITGRIMAEAPVAVK